MSALARWFGAGAALLAAAQPAAAAERSELGHTPWLGLRFVQQGQEAPLLRRGLLTTEVRLRRRPFQLLLPTRGPDDTYMIAAWTDDSIFGRAPVGADLEADGEGAYFGFGTGIADTEAGSGTLYLNENGHNHLTGLRLGPDPARHAVFYSAVFEQRAQTSMRSVDGPLYLVAFHDTDGDRIMDHGEYEFLILHFRR